MSDFSKRHPNLLDSGERLRSSRRFQGFKISRNSFFEISLWFDFSWKLEIWTIWKAHLELIRTFKKFFAGELGIHICGALLFYCKSAVFDISAKVKDFLIESWRNWVDMNQKFCSSDSAKSKFLMKNRRKKSLRIHVFFFLPLKNPQFLFVVKIAK